MSLFTNRHAHSTPASIVISPALEKIPWNVTKQDHALLSMPANINHHQQTLHGVNGSSQWWNSFPINYAISMHLSVATFNICSFLFFHAAYYHSSTISLMQFPFSCLEFLLWAPNSIWIYTECNKCLILQVGDVGCCTKVIQTYSAIKGKRPNLGGNDWESPFFHWGGNRPLRIAMVSWGQATEWPITSGCVYIS